MEFANLSSNGLYWLVALNVDREKQTFTIKTAI